MRLQILTEAALDHRLRQLDDPSKPSDTIFVRVSATAGPGAQPRHGTVAVNVRKRDGQPGDTEVGDGLGSRGRAG